MPQYHVDVPTTAPAGSAWDHIDSFETREAAIRFVQEYFGADENGNVCLVSEVSSEYDEEDEF